jgi:hypothetical protein
MQLCTQQAGEGRELTEKIDQFAFATLMTLLTAGAGGIFMVITWAKLLMNPPSRVEPKYSLALYSFTVSVCVGTFGSMIALLLSSSLRNTVWNFALLISFACVTASAVLVRKISGPGARALWFGSAALFLVDLIGFIGMILALPGMPLNR